MMAIMIGLGIVLAIIIAGIRVVSQQSVVIVETLGRYSKTMEAGLNWIFVPFQSAVGTLSLRIESVPAKVEVKTKDNMFVWLPVNLMIQVENDRAVDAFYKLENSHAQIGAWVLNSVRSIAASMTLEEMFNDRQKIADEVGGHLKTKLSEFGYRVENILIDQPTVPPEVQASFNRVVAAQREAEAAKQEAEASKIKIEANAKAESNAQQERARGLAESRKIIARGLSDSIKEFENVPTEMIMHTLVETNRIDAIREASRHGNLILCNLNQEGQTQNAVLGMVANQTKLKGAKTKQLQDESES